MDIVKEMGSTQWIEPLGFQLEETKQLFLQRLKAFKTKPEQILSAQKPIESLRTVLASKETITMSKLFLKLKEFESKLQEFRKKPEDWEHESLSQLVFTQEWSQPLNQVPYLLPALSIFKIYIFPFFAVIIPLISWILPYLVLRFMFGISMPFENYRKMLFSMWLGGKDWSIMTTWEHVRILFQTTWTLFGMAQGIIQPIQQAFHMKKINESIVERGQTLQRFVATVKEFFALYTATTGITVNSAHMDLWPTDEPLQLYAYVRDHPHDVDWIWTKIAKIELEWRIALCPDICFVKPRRGSKPFYAIRQFFDPSIPASRACASDFVSSAPHTLLTGPNKGGKSSILRAILLNTWLAQTMGIAFAESMELVPFHWIESGLRLVDEPGEQSLFERELAFAAKVIRRTKTSQRGLLVYDECFHSTNPPDGKKTSQRFLNHIWARSNVISLISTHVFELVEDAPAEIQRLCVPAEITPTGIRFSFSLAPGLCKVSSVEELYTKYRFPSADKPSS